MSQNVKLYRPQAGAQSMFLSTDADIAIYGGAAGGGKSYGVLLEAGSTAAGVVQRAKEAKCLALKDPKYFEGKKIPTSEFHAVIFRRQSVDLRNSGSLLDESKKMYYLFGASLKDQPMLWNFDKNVDVKFSGLPYDSSVHDWHGAQIDLLVFDELTHFSEYQFWYLMSRMRSSSGNVRPYLRATCNPEPNWVLDLINWWIGKDGYAIPERSGVIRWLIRLNGFVHWFDSSKDAIRFRDTNGLPEEVMPRSFTFIPSTIEDNPAMLKNNPDYISTLHSLPELEKKRLLMGNWRIQPSGKLFKIESFQTFSVSPKYAKKVIYVDTAQEIKTAHDFTVMQLWGKYKDSIYLDRQFRGKVEFNEQVDVLLAMIMDCSPNYVCIEKRANGSALIQSLKRKMRDVGVSCVVKAIERWGNKSIKGDKYTRGYECQGYIESGYVYLNPRADYYPDLVSEIVQFAPENKTKNSVHDDQVDCMMDAINDLLIKRQYNDIVNSNQKKSSTNARIQHQGKPTVFQGI